MWTGVTGASDMIIPSSLDAALERKDSCGDISRPSALYHPLENQALYGV